MLSSLAVAAVAHGGNEASRANEASGAEEEEGEGNVLIGYAGCPARSSVRFAAPPLAAAVPRCFQVTFTSEQEALSL